MPLLSTFGGASIRGFMSSGKTYKTYTLIADTTVGTATTSVTFSGLNYNASDELVLVADVVNPTASNSYVSMFVNGNTTRTNYYVQYMQVDGTSIFPGRGNDNELSMLPASSKIFLTCNFKMANSGYFLMQSNELLYGTSSAKTNYDFTTSTFTITSITSLTLTASATNAIGVGSRFQLYKINP